MGRAFCTVLTIVSQGVAAAGKMERPCFFIRSVHTIIWATGFLIDFVIPASAGTGSFMMKRLYWLLLLLGLSACAPKGRQTLNLAEEYLQQGHADSALVLLGNMNPSSLLLKGDLAEYALLKSMAMDKCYIDTDSDSLILLAVNHFNKRGAHRERMLSNYYYGRVLINAGRDAEAAVAMEKAAGQAEYLEEWLYAGLAERNLSELFANHFENEHAVEHALKSVAFFEKAGNSLYLVSGKRTLAIALGNNGQTEESLALFESLLKEESSLTPSIKRSYAHRLFLEDTQNAGRVLELLKEGLSGSYTANHFGSMAYASCLLGKNEEAQLYLKTADSLAVGTQDRGALAYDKYRIALFQKDSTRALRFLEETVNLQEAMDRELLQQSFSGAQKEIYKKEVGIQAERVQQQKRQMLAGGVVLILLAVALYVRNTQKKARILGLMAQMESLSESVERLRAEKNKGASHFLTKQMEQLRILSEEFWDSDDKKQQKIFYKSFQDQLKAFRKHDSPLVDLEGQVNRYKDGLMSLFREEFPGQTSHTYKMATLFFAGIPYDLIHFLTGTSIATLKSGKSVLKKEIMTSEAPHRDLFLLELESAQKRPAGRPRKDTVTVAEY